LERLAREQLALLLRQELLVARVMCLWQPHYQMADLPFMLMVVVAAQQVVVAAAAVN
jgi:hypothetical protein